MKKQLARILSVILMFAMLLAVGGCGKNQEGLSASAEAENTEPKWEPGTMRLGNWNVLWNTFQRGDTVTVLGQWEDYYIVEGQEADVLVEKRFLRLATDVTPEAADAWTKKDTKVHPTAYLSSEEPVTLDQNTEVKIVDGKDNWAYIEWADGTGYVDISMLSDHKISTPKKKASSGGSKGSSSGSSSGSNAPSTSAPAPAPAPAPSDGSDVNMSDLSFDFGRPMMAALLGAYSGPEYEAAEAQTGTILSDATEGYLCILLRDGEVKVTAVGEETCTVLFGDLTVEIDRWAIRLEADAAYEPWAAKVNGDAIAYAEYQCIHEFETFDGGGEVMVVDELTELGLYVVDIEGTYGYMQMEKLSKPSEEPEPSSSGNSGGGSSKGSSSGGSSSGGSSSGGSSSGSSAPAAPTPDPAPAEEWTAPVL